MRFENCCPFLVYRLGVFVNRATRKIFGAKRIKATGECRLHKEEFNDLHSPTNIIRVFLSSIMRWAGHVARRGRCIQSIGGEM
jgi:hypothetical protein